METHLTDQLFWALLIAWIIGAGALAHKSYREEREYKANSFKSGVKAGAWFICWWVVFAWEVWRPMLKEWWGKRE